MEKLYSCLFLSVLFLLGIGMFFALLRTIKGPRIADRIMGINMIGTMSLLCIAILAIYLKESWLLDVSLIYGMISFLAVVVLSIVYIDKKQRGKKQ